MPLESLPDKANVTQCDLVGVVVTADGVGLPVPAAGLGVGISVSGGEGTVDAMWLATDPDGTLTAEASTDNSAPKARRMLRAGECTDGAWNLENWVWDTTYRWYRGTGGGVSTNLSPTQLSGQMEKGVSNITDAKNDCGFVDQIDATNAFLGTDSRISDMTVVNGDPQCTTPDSVSTIDFGQVGSSGTQGVTCTWAAWTGAAYQSDIRINANKYWVNANAGCSTAQWDLQNAVTHEAGHVFGLAHVATPSLTMYSSGGACDISKRTLGLGDVLGLQVHY